MVGKRNRKSLVNLPDAAKRPGRGVPDVPRAVAKPATKARNRTEPRVADGEASREGAPGVHWSTGRVPMTWIDGSTPVTTLAVITAQVRFEKRDGEQNGRWYLVIPGHMLCLLNEHGSAEFDAMMRRGPMEQCEQCRKDHVHHGA